MAITKADLILQKKLEQACYTLGLVTATFHERVQDNNGKIHYISDGNPDSERKIRYYQNQVDIIRAAFERDQISNVLANYNGLFNFETAKNLIEDFSTMAQRSFPVLCYPGTRQLFSADIPNIAREDCREYLRMEAVNFGEQLDNYMARSYKYTRQVDWDATPMKRDSFHNVPGDKNETSKDNEKFETKFRQFWREYWN